MPLTSNRRTALLARMFNGTAGTWDTTFTLALFTSDPGDTGASGEVTGGSYARQSITFSTAASAACNNTAQIDFTGMPVATVTHVGIFNATTTFLGGGALSASKTTASGDTLRFAATTGIVASIS